MTAAPRGMGLGLTVETLSEEMAQTYGLKSGSGVVVTDVAPGTVAEAAGIKEGDRKSTRLNSSHSGESRMPSSA